MWRRARPGQSLLEFALVMPLLVALLVGIIELGGAWRATQALTHAAREGARQAAIPGSTAAQVTDRIRVVVSQAGLDPDRAELVLGLRDGTGTADTVTVRYPYRLPLLGPAVRLIDRDSPGPPGALTLASTTVMRNE